MHRRILAAIAAAVLTVLAAACGAPAQPAAAAWHPGSTPAPAQRPPYRIAGASLAIWHRQWWTNFPRAVPLGHFPGPLSAWWGAYPRGWPDSATEGVQPRSFGGCYDPATTVWVASGYMDIRMWRAGGAWCPGYRKGVIHSAAVYPRIAPGGDASGNAPGVKYGRFIEVTRVSRVTPGYKSAHLLWPVRGQRFEVDYPENEWYQSEPYVYVHGPQNEQISYGTRVSWGAWHTYEIRWDPHWLAFYVDGRRVGFTRQDVPDVPMSWIIQNESALFGKYAPPDSWAQMQIAHVEYWSYR